MSHLHLIGTGPLTICAAKIALGSGWGVSLRTSPRLWRAADRAMHALAAARVQVSIADDLEHAMTRGPRIGMGDIALSIGSPWIFSPTWIALWNGRAFNYHGRRLPEYRGGGGASWLIMAGDRNGGAVIHVLSAQVDQGPIVASRTFVYPVSARVPEDFRAVDESEGIKLIEDWLPKALKGEIQPQPQSDHLSTYWPRLSSKIHAWIDWSWTAEEIASFACAFDRPYEGACTYLRGVAVRLRNVFLEDAKPRHPYQAGLVFRIDKRGTHVAARNGSLIVGDVELPDITYPARLGDRLFTPRTLLEQALATRVFYQADGSIRTELAGPHESTKHSK